jgi:chemotaxis signal transduction protein
MGEMPLADRLLEIFDPEVWIVKCDEMIANFGVDDPAVIERVRQYMHGRLAKLRGMAIDLRGPDFEPDLRDTLTYWYLEAKAEWCQFNQRLNYQMIATGMPDSDLMLFGGVGTAVLEQVETLFSPAEIECLSDVMSAPLASSLELREARVLRVQPDQRAISKDLFDGLQACLQNLVDFQFTMGAAVQIQECHGGAGVAQELRHALTGFEEQMASAQRHLQAFHDLTLRVPQMQNFVAEVGAAVGLRVSFLPTIAREVAMTREIAESFLTFFELWVTELLRLGCEAPAQRATLGKSAHITLKATLRQEEQAIAFEIEDDGRGLDPAELAEYGCPDGDRYDFLFGIDPGRAAADQAFGLCVARCEALRRIKGVDVRIESRPGEGTRVRVACPPPRLLGSEQYVVAKAGGQEFAIACAQVRFLAQVAPEQIQTENTSPTVILHGETYAVRSLASLVGLPGGESHRQTAIALRFGEQNIALLVDTVSSLETAICRPLEHGDIRFPNFVTGALYLAGGQVCLVLGLEEMLGFDGALDRVIPSRTAQASPEARTTTTVVATESRTEVFATPSDEPSRATELEPQTKKKRHGRQRAA